MNAKLRVAIFCIFAAGFAAIVVWCIRPLPRFGHYPGPYGDLVIEDMRHHHATNAVTTVVMDVRAVDTAGEELILLASAIGVLMLLRKGRGELEDPSDDAIGIRPHNPPVAARAACEVLVGAAALLGLYIVAHGQLTPGGGFQGGVVLASPSLLVLLAGRTRAFRRVHPSWPWELAQGVAVTAFLGIGWAGLVLGRGFLANVFGLGKTGTVASAGTIPVLNLIAGPAVATAIVLVAVALLEQMLELP